MAVHDTPKVVVSQFQSKAMKNSREVGDFRDSLQKMNSITDTI